ncbi:hypothetical protein IQ268_10610 [Oculatella sp. LEGE 06141]|uniref:hypothetical protein n=1 Tax=Oculatella sp. LEGE 06141 TaxID=1828648 RepID=UPI00187FA2D5|nr:hypothetical protein [Oculatella sp. LEGE 06141]MBE9179011.1 hypothetical protein [Oculatella sp. LEGE 06141]
MDNIAERYTRLCHAYVQLADQFQKLDVEHMSLRGKIIPFLKALKTYKQTVADLTEEKSRLEAELQAIASKYEALKPLEALIDAEHQAALAEAEEQLNLVAETLQEMEKERDPDLSEAERLLLAEYDSSDAEFSLAESVDESHHANVLPFAS